MHGFGNDPALPEDMGRYVSNDTDTSYDSIFERDGIEPIVRDSVIGGSRSSLFNDGWRFFETDDFNTDLSAVELDDSAWTRVTLPHDFQILKRGDMGSRAALTADKKGWYRKRFTLPEELSEKRVSVRFDGIYQASRVYLNGEALPEYGEEDSSYSDSHCYGYKTFEVDLTGRLCFGGENVIAVSAEDRHPSSRWYTGAGINRNVWLTVTGAAYIPLHGTYVSYELDRDRARARVKAVTEIKSSDAAEITVRQTLYIGSERTDAAIPDARVCVRAGETVRAAQSFTLTAPRLWGLSDDESENLYSLHTEIITDSKTSDTYITEFGIREIRWEKDSGVCFNGERTALRGVCQHENLGSLGSASNAAALERQVMILKKMGANAIRTAHNMCAPELITICNRRGMLVFEEAFDSWDDDKDGAYSPGGQGLFLDTYESDLRSMIRRDRNAPCVFMWSIGNEIIQTVWGSMDASWSKIENMLRFIHDEDPDGKRFVTLAQMQWTTDFSQEVSARICDFYAQNFGDYGVMGENYREYYMEKTHEKYPDYRYVSTESSSAVRSRGVYHEGRYVYSHDDLQVSSLDNAGPAYYIPAEDLYKFDTNRGWYAGQFIWTGFDYIGEPTPYDTKNSYFGIVDTAGLPKDIYYFYKSVWNESEDTVHILPAWDKNDGDKVNIRVYSNAERVDLCYVPAEGSGCEPVHLTDTISRAKRFTEKWSAANKPVYEEKLHFSFDLIYHPGTIYAAAVYADGHRAYTSLSTPSEAAKLTLRADRRVIAADGRDMSFVEINAVDENGNLSPYYSGRVMVEVEGAAELVSTDSGNSVDYDSYQSETRRLFNGKAAAYLRSNGSAGGIRLRVSGVGVKAAELTLRAAAVDMPSGSPVIDAYPPADSTLDASIPLGKTRYAEKLEITPVNGTAPILTADCPSAVFGFRLLPDGAYDDGSLKFSVIGTEGYLRVNNASLSVDEAAKTITVTGLKPGVFRIYGTCGNGNRQPQLLSVYTVTNESAVSDDPSLANNAYAGISAVRLDPSSNNQSYRVDYDKGVVTGIYRADDTLVYKDVEFGADYSRELILNCANPSSNDARVEIYVDGGPRTETIIPKGAAMGGHRVALHGITGTHDLTFRNAEQGPSLSIESFRFTGSGTDPYNAYERIEAERFDCCAAAERIPRAVKSADGSATLEIMDNAGVYYKGIDFGKDGSDLIELSMKRTAGSGNIAITIDGGREQYPDWASLPGYKEGEYSIYRFKLDRVYTGIRDVSLFAYPGAAVYIDWFRFIKRA